MLDTLFFYVMLAKNGNLLPTSNSIFKAVIGNAHLVSKRVASTRNDRVSAYKLQNVEQSNGKQLYFPTKEKTMSKHFSTQKLQ